jgi:hypothetical protein
MPILLISLTGYSFLRALREILVLSHFSVSNARRNDLGTLFSYHDASKV